MILDLDEFFGGLLQVSATFTLPDLRVGSATQGGSQENTAQGRRLWGGAVNLVRLPYGDWDAVAAKLELLTAADARFVLRPSHRLGPQSDPKGAALQGSALSIEAFTGDTLRIVGLPGQFQLKAGDLVSFDFGARQSLHRITGNKQAYNNGKVTVAVVPPVPASTQIGASVHLAPAKVTGEIIPGSYKPAAYGAVFASGGSFQWRQVMK